MSAERAQLLILKGIVAELPEADQTAVKTAKEKIEAVLKELGEPGGIALAMVGLEMAAGEMKP